MSAKLIGFNVNGTVLPGPVFSVVHEFPSGRLAAYTKLVIVFSAMDGIVAQSLSRYFAPSPATLGIQLTNGGWVSNIPVTLQMLGNAYQPVIGGDALGLVIPGLNAPPGYLTASFLSSIILYCTILQNTPLVAPQAPAMHY